MKALLPALARPLLEPHLPADLDVDWFANREEAMAKVGEVNIAWVDQQRPEWTAQVIDAGTQLKWVSTIYAGIDSFPVDALKQRGTLVTNGAGINAYAVAEYAVMGVLAGAKRFDQVVRAADRREWLRETPGRIELFETSALVIGYGAIGALIGERLEGFGVTVTGVKRTARDGFLGPDDWRARLGEFDWVVLAAPSTGATKTMIGADELAAMKSSAWLINIARGDMVDQDALLSALDAKQIAGAFLDVTDPEPLPSDSPLWNRDDVMLTMHMSGRSQTRMFPRAAKLFVENLHAFLGNQPMKNLVDLDAGY